MRWLLPNAMPRHPRFASRTGLSSHVVLGLALLGAGAVGGLLLVLGGVGDTRAASPQTLAPEAEVDAPAPQPVALIEAKGIEELPESEATVEVLPAEATTLTDPIAALVAEKPKLPGADMKHVRGGGQKAEPVKPGEMKAAQREQRKKREEAAKAAGEAVAPKEKKFVNPDRGELKNGGGQRPGKRKP